MPDTTTAQQTTSKTYVQGAPRVLLRLEGALALVAAIAMYRHLDGGWGWLAALFFVPDVSMLGYLAGPRIGAMLYNAGHSYIGPALLAAISLTVTAPPLLLGALIWMGHIGFDRMLGYGLKYGTRFSDTHLGAALRAHSRAARDPSAHDRVPPLGIERSAETSRWAASSRAE